MQTDSAINVYIVHSKPILAAGLAAILSRTDAVEVCPQRGMPASLTDDGIVILDYEGGLAYRREMQARKVKNGARVMIVTQCDKEHQMRVAMDSGVQAYVLQGCEVQELEQAVQLLKRGMRYLSASLTNCVADSLRREHLTGRETEVLHLVAAGHGNKAIARELGIGLGTVKSYVKAVMSKLDAKGRTQAVVVAGQRGLLDAA